MNSYVQPQYRRVNQDQSMPQRMKQMNLHSPPGYPSTGPYDTRMPFPTNGERTNGYYYSYGQIKGGIISQFQCSHFSKFYRIKTF